MSVRLSQFLFFFVFELNDDQNGNIDFNGIFDRIYAKQINK